MADKVSFVKGAMELRSPLSSFLAKEPLIARFRPGSVVAPAPRPAVPPQPPPVAAPPPPVAAIPPAPALLPAAPLLNPFASLPFRSPGDRIKAGDFNALAKALQVIGDAYVLSGALFGETFSQAKLLLAAQQYEIVRVVSVFGAEVDTLADTSLDTRKVIQLLPVVLGERRVMVVVTEAVETRRFAPNLMGLTYREAFERQKAMFGEGTFPSTPLSAVSLISHSLKDAAQLLTP